MSASSSPTRAPGRESATARFALIVDLLRPPFPDPTAARPARVSAWEPGATPETDAYFVAFTIPDFLNYLLAGGSLSITFLPLCARYLAEGKEEEGFRSFSTIATVMGIGMLFFIVLGEFLAGRVIPLIAPGFPPEQAAIAARLTRIVLPAPIFFYLGGLLMAVQYARKQFFVPALAPLVYNLGIILGGLLLGREHGMAGVAWVAHARLRLLPSRGSDHVAEQRPPPDAGARRDLRPGIGGGLVPLSLLAGGGGKKGGDVGDAVPHPPVGLPRLGRGGGHRLRPVAGSGPPRLPARCVHHRRHHAHGLRPLRLLPRDPVLVRPGDRLPRGLRDARHLDADTRGDGGVGRRPPRVLPPPAVVRRLRPRAGQFGGDPPLRGDALRDPDEADGGAAGAAGTARVRETGAGPGGRRCGGGGVAVRGFAGPRG